MSVTLPSCCKGQAGLKQLMLDYKEYHWYVYLEPNVYVRHQYLQDYVSHLDPQEPVTLTSGVSRPMGFSDYDGSAYNCSVPSSHFLYPFGHPIVLSQAAMKVMAPAGFIRGGLMAQCKEYGDTSLDVGLQILPWMYSVPSLFIDIVYEPGKEDWMIRAFIEIEETHRSVVDRPIPTKHQFQWHRVHHGFEQTELFRTHGAPRTWTKWHLFETKHCWVENPRDQQELEEEDKRREEIERKRKERESTPKTEVEPKLVDATRDKKEEGEGKEREHSISSKVSETGPKIA